MNEYMQEAIKQREKSTCLRSKVGAVVVKDNKIIAYGYNNAVGGIKPCTEIGCIRDRLHIKHGERREVCRYICAEQMIVSEAARNGLSLDGGIVYVTTFPCVVCAKLLVNAGIKEIVYLNDYPDEFSKEFLREVGVPFRQI